MCCVLEVTCVAPMRNSWSCTIGSTEIVGSSVTKKLGLKLATEGKTISLVSSSRSGSSESLAPRPNYSEEFLTKSANVRKLSVGFSEFINY